MTFHYPVRHIAIKSMTPQRAGHPAHRLARVPPPPGEPRPSNFVFAHNPRFPVCTPHFQIHIQALLQPVGRGGPGLLGGTVVLVTAGGDSAVSLGA